MLRKIISGGQVGADRAGLDWALKNGLEAGGWCPKGRISLDGKIPDKYPLKETSSAEYHHRTRLNVADADATVIFTSTPMGRGSALAQRYCGTLKKPCLILTDEDKGAHRLLAAFTDEHNVETLNVAGGRDKYDLALAVLNEFALWLLPNLRTTRSSPKKFLVERRAPLGHVGEEEGLEAIAFKDATGMPGSLAQCGSKTELGEPAIWLGIDGGPRLLLGEAQVRDLFTTLDRWLRWKKFTR